MTILLAMLQILMCNTFTMTSITRYIIARDTSIDSVKYATKISLKADVPDVNNFLARLTMMSGSSICCSVSHVSFEQKSLSQWDWLNIDRQKTIAQLSTLEAGFHTVKTYFKGYYNACGKCSVKVKSAIKVGDICENPRCKQQISDIVQRFKNFVFCC